MKKISLLTVFVCIYFLSFGQDSKYVAERILKGEKIYTTKKINSLNLKTDGDLNDKQWEEVQWSGDFTQLDPTEGENPSQNTEIKILYDDNNLYIGFKVYDKEPDKIEKRMSRRDSWDGDYVAVHIDSYYDKKTAFIFSVNAAGVRSDAISIDDSRYDRDDTWDPIWAVETSLTDYGWSAEMKIPLSQLRFGKKDHQTWGLQVERYLFRENETSMWKYIPKTSSGWTSLYGELYGIKNLSPKRQIEIAPFISSKYEMYEKEVGNPFQDGSDLNYNAGIDGKIGITNDLTLDFAVNPDFGQVEADPSEVNLTAYETFFSEKRPFFVEGNNITNFQITFGGSPWSSDNLFYSRRLGSNPHYYPETADGEYIRMPQNTRILGAIKLTGKTKTGLSIGIIESFTNKEFATIDLDGDIRKEEVEPYTNYFTGRIQKDMNKGNTVFGGMITSTYRFTESENLDFLNKNATTGGIDFTQYFKDKKYIVEAKIVGSHIIGSTNAITEQQLSSRRYFQMPDADYLIYDTTGTSLSGYGGNVLFAKQGNKGLRYAANITWRSPGVELNDIGYLRKANSIFQFVWLGYKITEPVSIFRSAGINVNQWGGWDFGGVTNFFGGNINAWTQFNNLWMLNFYSSFETLNNDNSILRGGPSMKTPGSINYGANIRSNSTKKLSFGLGFNDNIGLENSNRSFVLSTNLRYNPIKILSISLAPYYNFRNSDLQYVGTEEYKGEDQYLFGEIVQKTFSVVARIDFNITPDFTIQYYGAPFISAGLYSNYKKITDPKANVYQDRFELINENQMTYIPEDELYGVNETGNENFDYYFDYPDFNYQQYRSNLVLRWEYRPGSLFYFVWSQDRTEFITDGNFNFINDLKSMFSIHSKDVFLIKFSYRFIQ